MANATQDHYLFHHIAYALDAENNLDYRVKTFYAAEQFSLPKKTFEELAKKLGEVKVYTEPDAISLVGISTFNNYVIIKQG